MSKKSKQLTLPNLSPSAIRARAERATEEGRYQHALELAKQLYKQDSSPAQRDLLLRIYLGRAQQLRQQGHPRDAQTVLDNALQLADGDPAWLEKLAEELALAGNGRRALNLLERIPGSPARARISAQAADSALQQGAAGRHVLPETLADSFDRILQAFAQLEASEDDGVRETLQGIGLQSPFLEWKVLLRGLLAFYQNDDERALENWQRLDPERLPARLAAPLRFQIDPAYRQAQPPSVQAVLQRQADALQASGLVPPLRILQGVLAHADQLPQSFRLAEGFVQALGQQFPQLVPRLAACFYWTVLSDGQPEDIRRYERVFGLPAEDPGLDRLRALWFEHQGDMAKAHFHWRQFESSVASNPAAWPGEQSQHVRALIWCRMGRNAASVPDTDKIPDLPPFLRDHPDRPRPLSPSAPECFRRSLELVPAQLAAHEELLHYHKEEKNEPEAEQTARRLLEYFPDHVPALVELADLRGHQGDHAEALTLLQRALKVNPLDRSLRTRVGIAHLLQARTHAEAGRFAEARAEYQLALSYREGKDESTALYKWAACEFKAGDSARAEELLQTALAESGSRLALAYEMLIETIRLQLPSKLKSRFNKAFKEGLAETPTAAVTARLARIAAVHRLANVIYRGQKAHEKQILTYVEGCLPPRLRSASGGQGGVEFAEEQLVSLATSLLDLKAFKVLRKFTALGRHRFPRNPHFYLLEAESYFAQGPYRLPVWKLQPLLSKAAKLIHDLPADEAQKALLEKIEHLQQVLGMSGFLLNPHSMEALAELLGQRIGGFEDEFEDYYNDDEY